MIIEVIAIKKHEAAKAREGLSKLRKGIAKVRWDLRDGRIDVPDLKSFIDCLRAAADYFEEFLEDNDGKA